MQAYGKSFAKAYNLMWTDFADMVGPPLTEFYGKSEQGKAGAPVLDLCCGVGTVSLHFLAAGYRVWGIDLSEAMLQIARDNAREYVASGRAEFIKADAADFTLDQSFGLVTATFDSLNHLPDFAGLKSCFRCVHAALEPGGHFFFDLNTRAGLKRWDQIEVLEEDELTIIKRGGFDTESNRAFHRVSGFIKVDSGLFERFDETIVEQAFDIGETAKALNHAGFRDLRITDSFNLEEESEISDKDPRVFILATK